MAAGPGQDELARRLRDLGDERLRWMDAVGLDTQVVSLTSPGLQNLEPNDATALQVDVNDRPRRRHPGPPRPSAGIRHPRQPPFRS